jgi:8-oxo-dGTP diphosphatase
MNGAHPKALNTEPDKTHCLEVSNLSPQPSLLGPESRQAHSLIAVDVVVFTIDEGELKALLVEVKEGPFAGRWAFPGGLVGIEEPLEEAAIRELNEKTGLRGIYLEQLRTFGAPERDPGARVVSTAYFALVPNKSRVQPQPKYARVGWFPVRRLPSLAYDHDEMAAYALQRLRAKLEYTNIVYGLLPAQFTLSELQEVYEVILGRRLDRRNFRKKILASGLVRALPKYRYGAHRPARLYAFTRRKPMVISIL